MARGVRRLPEPAKSGNPFVHRIDYTIWMYVKLFAGVLLLLPIRLLLTPVFMLALYVCVRLSSSGWKPGQHMQPWQKYIVTTIAPPIVRLWVFCAFGFYHVPVKGRRASAAEAPITVVAPHSCIMETWMVMLFTYGMVISRVENQNFPYVSSCIKACEPIWVGGSVRGGSTVEEMTKRITSPGRWLPIVIFPEGTTHNADALLSFKTGAFQPGYPVQPVIFRFGKPQVGVWGNHGNTVPKIVLLLMCQWHNTFEVEYLPVYRPSEEERQDARLYSRNVRAVMTKAADLPCMDYSREELSLMEKVHGAGLPLDAALIEYDLINRLFGVRLPALQVVLERFIQMNTSKSGVVGSNEFMMHLAWPIREHALLLFKEYDTCSDGREELRYREYVVGTLDLATKVPNAAQVVSDAFEALSDGQDQLSTTGILDAMHRRGFSDVSTDSVERFLYKMSQSSDLSVSGFASYVESNPDLNILLVWYLRGTATDV
eukprot:scpid40095/ scgid21550/ Lysophosphatidylcholine acyltransferase 2B; Acyltransferase-like 1-B